MSTLNRHVHGQSKGYAGRCAEACEASWQRLASPCGPIQHGGERSWGPGNHVHFGLVEGGGFVRHSELTRQQMSSMLIQERANMVMSDMRQRMPDTTDAPPRPSIGGVPTPSWSCRALQEQMWFLLLTKVIIRWKMVRRKQQQTDDDMDNGDGNENQTDGTQLSNLMTNLRRLINEALAAERFEDASELQSAAVATLTAAIQNSGLNMELVTTVRNCFQRLYRKARNRGEEGLATTFRVYADCVFERCEFNFWWMIRQKTMVCCWRWDTGQSQNPMIFPNGNSCAKDNLLI